jgi:hypothetical protein
MGGNHLTSDDMFIAAEMSIQEKEKHRLEVLKKKFERAAKGDRLQWLACS